MTVDGLEEFTAGHEFGFRQLRGSALPRRLAGLSDMPAYFFHIRTPEALLVDDVGIELRDLEQVRVEAVRGARSMMASSLKAGHAVDHQVFEICNEAGELVLRLRFRDVLTVPDDPSAPISGKN